MILQKVVLLIKAQSGSSQFGENFQQDIERTGCKLQYLQAIDFVFVNLDSLKKKLDSPDLYDGIIFSSPRCVQTVKSALENEKLNKSWLAKENYVVGVATYNSALEELGLNCFGKETGNGNVLSDYIETRLSQPQGDSKSITNKYLYPCGNLKLDTIENRLKCVNITLDAVETYETGPSPSLNEDFGFITNNFEDCPEFLVFFSPSGVKNIAPLLRRLKCETKDVKFIAIGPTTEKAMIQENILVSGIAAKPTAEDVLKIIKSFVQ